MTLRTFARRLGGCSLVLALLGLPGLLLLSSCMSFTKTQAEVDAYFRGKPYPPHDRMYTVGKRVMHAVETGAPDRRLVLFIHGTPGSWTAFMHYLADPDLLARAHLIAVDRAGFGASGRGEVEPSLAAQAADIAPLLLTNRDPRPPIIVGHSLGGPIAVRLAMDYPDRVGALLLLAPSLDPAQEHLRWYQRPADWWLLRWAVPEDLRTCNEEILPLRGQLQAMLPLYPRLALPITILHGAADELVPIANTTVFAPRVFTHADLHTVVIPGENHFIPWTQMPLVKQTLLDLLR